VPRPGAQPDRPPVVDLHKSWHMFHFLFTGRAEGGSPPGSLLMEGGEEVGEDLGYGPARLIGPADTAVRILSARSRLTSSRRASTSRRGRGGARGRIGVAELSVAGAVTLALVSVLPGLGQRPRARNPWPPAAEYGFRVRLHFAEPAIGRARGATRWAPRNDANAI
jgi:hypothetical protein